MNERENAGAGPEGERGAFDEGGSPFAWDLGGASSKLAARVKFLLWDYARGSIAYDVAFVVVVLILLLVPPGFWGDPLCSR